MKILIVGGLGSIGRRHVTNLKILGYDADICDVNGGDYKDIGDVPSLSAYKVVFICTPTPTHLELLHYCNDRGVPFIFCEKPIDLWPTGNKMLLDGGNPQIVIKELKSQIYINHAYRFERGLLKLKELMDNGLAGNIRHISLENSYSFKKLHPHYKLENYDGILYDDSHIINVSRFLTGNPKMIFSKYIEKQFAQWNWESETGIIVSHMTDALNERYKKRIEVRGDKGTLVYNFRAHEVFFAPADESERIAIPYRHSDHLMEALRWFMGKVERNEVIDINDIHDSWEDLRIIGELCES